jgi:hypothetical protein
MTRGSLNVIVTLGRGIPLGNPRSGWLVRYTKHGRRKRFSQKNTYHPVGRGGGEKLGPVAFGEAAGLGGLGAIFDVWCSGDAGFTEGKTRGVEMPKMEYEMRKGDEK